MKGEDDDNHYHLIGDHLKVDCESFWQIVIEIYRVGFGHLSDPIRR